MPRDRIALEFTSNRATIARVYPEEDELNRLANIAGYAIEHTELGGIAPMAFGYNMELVCKQTSGHTSLRYLGDRLFAEKEFGASGWQFLGGSGKMLFRSPVGQWTIHLEPRANDSKATRVFFSANLHKAEQRFPNSEEMRQSLKDLWEQAHDFIKRLNGSS